MPPATHSKNRVAGGFKVLKQSIGRRNRMARENRLKAAQEHKKQLAQQAVAQGEGDEKLSTPAVEDSVGNPV